MTQDEIAVEWQRDTSIDMTELGGESTKIPKLHDKYLKMLIDAQSEEREARYALRKMNLLKTEYYLGQLDKKTMDRFGWPPFLKKVMKPDLYLWLEADVELQGFERDLSIATAKTKQIEEIIKTLHGRGYLIKNALDWIKFQNGG